MALTYEAIATVTVGSGGAANIEFTSIPGTYTDLCVVISARNDASNITGFMALQPNGSSTNISNRYLFGDGSSAFSAIVDSPTIGGIGAYCAGDTATASTFGSIEYYIPNYTSSNNKSIASMSTAENNATTSYMALIAGLWSNTAAITSIKIITGNNATGNTANFKQHSTATLYGIKNTV